MRIAGLPDHYRQVAEVNLKTDALLLTLLNALGTFLFLNILGVGFLIQPVAFNVLTWYHLLWLGLGLVLYIVAHEGIHALCMKMFSNQALTLGVNAQAAYAGMKNAYFTKREYAIIALSPCVALGFILLGALFFYWTDHGAYVALLVILGQNFAGSVGDYYVFQRLASLPKDALVNDDGLKMHYYARKKSLGHQQ